LCLPLVESGASYGEEGRQTHMMPHTRKGLLAPETPCCPPRRAPRLLRANRPFPAFFVNVLQQRNR
jgi:hypothetical protein